MSIRLVIIFFLLVGCSSITESEIVEIPVEVVTSIEGWGINCLTQAEPYQGQYRLLWSYALTKMDSSEVDSVWIHGFAIRFQDSTMIEHCWEFLDEDWHYLSNVNGGMRGNNLYEIDELRNVYGRMSIEVK